MGHLYQRGKVWWVKYYVNGRPMRESTGTTKEQEAGRILKAREGRAAAGLPVIPRADRIRYDEAAQDLRDHYRATGSRDLAEAEGRLAHLDAAFRGRRLASLGQADVTAYALRRQGQGAANGTINRELAVLIRMLRLAYESSKLIRLPTMHKLKEAGPRQGFFEREQFEAVRRHLRPDLQLVATICYQLGWRVRSEVLALERRHVDLEAGTLRLEPGTTKNDEGRLCYVTPELRAMLAAQVERVRALERKTGRIIAALFPHLQGARTRKPGQRGRVVGEPMRNFRKAWATACKAAGVAGMLRHDFRRTAVRNMVNAGVPERVAMKVTGHKTRAVFDRYHIVSPGDLQDVARRLAGTIPGTVTPRGVDGRSVSV